MAKKQSSGTGQSSPRRTSSKKKSAKKTTKKKGTGKKKTSRSSRAGKSKTTKKKTTRRRSQREATVKRSTVAQVILEREFSRAPRSGGPGVTLLGLDLGTRRSVLAASRAGHLLQLSTDLTATVVGSPRQGVALAGGSRYVFGTDALRLAQHLHLTFPVREGVVHDMEICRKFVSHLRSRLDAKGAHNVWTVVSAPTDSTHEQRSRIRQVMLGAFERTFIVPEPYLAALGMVRESMQNTSKLPVSQAVYSLVVDIGNRSTRLCLLRGELPERTDQLRLERGGTFVDDFVLAAAHVRGGLHLTPALVRNIKEEQGLVDIRGHNGGNPSTPGSELLSLVYSLRDACEQLLSVIADGVEDLIENTGLSPTPALFPSVVLTGRSSRIPGFASRLEKLLEERGFGAVSVLVPSDHVRLVAAGGLHVAEALSDDEWSTAEEEQRLQEGAARGQSTANESAASQRHAAPRGEGQTAAKVEKEPLIIL